MTEAPILARGYERTYELFDTPLMQTVRREAYGEDIGQHSWVTAAELREAIQALDLSSDSKVLDFGCGPCGPATFIAKDTGCKVIGVDMSPAALLVGKRRSKTLDIAHLLELHEADGNSVLPFVHQFDAIVSYDVVLHLRNRLNLFNQFSSYIRRKGRLLVTDAAVLTGAISNEEVRLRSINGFTQFVPNGYNERALENCGFKLLSVIDRTSSLIKNAVGRLSARANHSEEVISVEGPEQFHAQQQYLQTVVDLAERKVLCRMAYLLESSDNAL